MIDFGSLFCTRLTRLGSHIVSQRIKLRVAQLRKLGHSSVDQSPIADDRRKTRRRQEDRRSAQVRCVPARNHTCAVTQQAAYIFARPCLYHGGIVLEYRRRQRLCEGRRRDRRQAGFSIQRKRKKAPWITARCPAPARR